jgi:hypothetical protein
MKYAGRDQKEFCTSIPAWEKTSKEGKGEQNIGPKTKTVV